MSNVLVLTVLGHLSRAETKMFALKPPKNVTKTPDDQ